MLIKKTYKFYAAHRNEELQDKCRNVHGHRYEIRCHFRVHRHGSISTLFADFDRRIEPLLQQEYDHAMLVNVHDPLYKALAAYRQQSGDLLRLKCLDGPTSVENLAFQLFSEILAMGFDLETLEVQETDTSTLVYSREDWLADRGGEVQGQGTADEDVASVDCHGGRVYRLEMDGRCFGWG